MKLFISGNDRNSRLALDSLQQLCETNLKGAYSLDIIDVLQDFENALKHNVLVAPTLIITSTQPHTIFIGSLQNPTSILEALGLPKKENGQ